MPASNRQRQQNCSRYADQSTHDGVITPIKITEMSECCDLSIDDRQNVIGKASQLLGVMTDPDQRGPRLGKLLGQLLDGVACLAVQCCSRLLSQNNHRISQ